MRRNKVEFILKILFILFLLFENTVAYAQNNGINNNWLMGYSSWAGFPKEELI
jgi:hypothetical protein